MDMKQGQFPSCDIQFCWKGFHSLDKLVWISAGLNLCVMKKGYSDPNYQYHIVYTALENCSCNKIAHPFNSHFMLSHLTLMVVCSQQIVFEGIRGSSYTGDIALDDITFTVGASNCILQPSDALPPGWTTAAPPTATATARPTTIGRWIEVAHVCKSGKRFW